MNNDTWFLVCMFVAVIFLVIGYFIYPLDKQCNNIRTIDMTCEQLKMQYYICSGNAVCENNILSMMNLKGCKI